MARICPALASTVSSPRPRTPHGSFEQNDNVETITGLGRTQARGEAVFDPVAINVAAHLCGARQRNIRLRDIGQRDARLRNVRLRTCVSGRRARLKRPMPGP